MKDQYQISCTDNLSKECLVERLDKLALEKQLLSIKYKEALRESQFYERLYKETFNRLSKVGL